MSSIKNYLENMSKMTREIRPDNPFVYVCLEEFILKYGREFNNHKKHRIRHGRMKECFRNAFYLTKEKGLVYVEGFAVCLGLFPIYHAWCIDKEGNVYDPTWKDGQEYYGVPFDFKYVKKIMLETKQFGTIDNWKQHFPLLKGRHTNFLHKDFSYD